LVLALLPLLLVGLAALLSFVLGPGTSADAVYSGMSSMEGMSGQDMANMPGMGGMEPYTGARVRGHASYVSVAVAEEGIIMPSVTHAGPTTFQVFNLGVGARHLRIEGPGVAKHLLVHPGEKVSWTGTLRVGTYRVASTDAAGVRRGPVTTLRVGPL
jgi:hypothetical protein